jgi:hypothetical protein
MTDVMWGKPDGTRVLLAPCDLVASFVSSIYDFDIIDVVPISVHEFGNGLQLTAGPLNLTLTMGTSRRIFQLRPSFLRRSLLWVRVEDLALRRIVGRFVLKGAKGVRSYGKTRTGLREWYRIHEYRPIVEGRAFLDGCNLGSLSALHPRLGVGFSEYPQQPAVVSCSPVLEGPVS